MNESGHSGRRERGGRPRVLVVGLTWPLETFLARLVRGLAAAGLEVVLASPAAPGAEWRHEEGLTVLVTPAWNGFLPLRVLRLARLALAAFVRSPREAIALSRRAAEVPGVAGRLRMLNRLLPFAGIRWDAVYFPWNLAAVDYEALLDMGRPAVISCRGSQINVAPRDPGRPGLAEDLRLGFAKAAAVHCVSEAILREAMPYGLDPSKAVVIRPAVDAAEFHPTAAPATGSGALALISTGALRWVKGYDYALVAVRRLLDEGVAVRLRIVGEGPERARLRHAIEDMGLERHVELAGRLAPARVLEELQHADIFLLTSVSEGISNAVLEAMACGLPVVTTSCGGMAEVVRQGTDGFLVPVRDPEAIAAAVSRLAADAGLRRRMGQAGRERVLHEFRLDRQLSEFARLFERVTRWQLA